MQQYPINVPKKAINPAKATGIGCLALTVLLWVMPDGCAHCLRSAREKAAATTCMSNLKQLSIGALQYSEDWDGTFPAAKTWTEGVSHYIQPNPNSNAAVFHCPDAEAATKPGFYPTVYSYAYNNRLSKLKLATIDIPNETVLMYDSSTLFRDAADAFTSTPTPGRHVAGNNITFADGHAKRVGDVGIEELRHKIELNRPKAQGK